MSYAGGDPESSGGVYHWNHRGDYYTCRSDYCTGDSIYLIAKEELDDRHPMNSHAYTVHYTINFIDILHIAPTNN